MNETPILMHRPALKQAGCTFFENQVNEGEEQEPKEKVSESHTF